MKSRFARLRRQARDAGLSVYYTGHPCPAGHTTWRFVSNGRCRTCVQRGQGAVPNCARPDYEGFPGEDVAWVGAAKPGYRRHLYRDEKTGRIHRVQYFTDDEDPVPVPARRRVGAVELPQFRASPFPPAVAEKQPSARRRR